MNTETKYAYQKRIKELEEKVSTLEGYRSVAVQIYDECVQNLGEGDQSMNMAAVLRKMRYLLK